MAKGGMRRTGQVPHSRDMHVPFCPVAVFTSPDKTKLGKWEERAVEGIFVGWDLEDPHVYFVRLTGGKSVKELIKTNDEIFKEIIRVHYVVFDDFFNSCKNDSPTKRMFQNRCEDRGILKVDLRDGKVFQFGGPQDKQVENIKINWMKGEKGNNIQREVPVGTRVTKVKKGKETKVKTIEKLEKLLRK